MIFTIIGIDLVVAGLLYLLLKHQWKKAFKKFEARLIDKVSDYIEVRFSELEKPDFKCLNPDEFKDMK